MDVGLSFLGDMLIALVNRDVVNSVTSMDLASFKAAIFIGIAAVAVFLASVLSGFFNMRSIRYIMYDMRRDLFRHMEFLPVEYYDKNHSADSIFRLNSKRREHETGLHKPLSQLHDRNSGRRRFLRIHTCHGS